MEEVHRRQYQINQLYRQNRRPHANRQQREQPT